MSSVRTLRAVLLAGLVGGALVLTSPVAFASASVVVPPGPPPPPASSVAVPATSAVVASGDGGDYWASDRCHYFRVGDRWASDQCVRRVPDASGRPTPAAFGFVANTGGGTDGRELVRVDLGPDPSATTANPDHQAPDAAALVAQTRRALRDTAIPLTG